MGTCRLSVNAFFYLLTLMSLKNGETQKDVFNTLTDIAAPRYYKTDSNSLVSQVRNATKDLSGHMVMSFCDENHIFMFREKMNNHYSDALREMTILLDQSFRFAESEQRWIKIALARLIHEDTTIPTEANFWVSINNPIAKESLYDYIANNNEPFDIYVFVLSVWYYTCKHQIPYKNYAPTIREWKKNPKVRPYIEFVTASESNQTDASIIHTRSITGKFKEYRKSLYNRMSKQHTFLYDTEQDFYRFFVCNDISYNQDNHDVFDEEETTNYVIKNVKAKDLLRPEFLNRILITGVGGAGKSMLLTHLLLNSIEELSDDKVPVFINLRNYEIERASTNDFEDFIFEHFRLDGKKNNREQYDDALTSGNLILFMDGLDEVKPEYTYSFNKAFEYFSIMHQNTAIIMTSRPITNFSLSHQFVKMHIMPFSIEQAKDMIRRIDNHIANKKLKDDFINELETDAFNFSHDEKNGFLGNPLLLSIMLLTYKYNYRIPEAKYLFYEDAYTAMAKQIDASRNLHRDFKTGLSEIDFKFFFAMFCATSSYKGQLMFREKEFEDTFAYVEKHFKQDVNMDAFVEDITRKICFMYKEGNEYYFIHRTFQEFFTAYFYSRQTEEKMKVAYQYFTRLHATSGDETLSMLYGLDDKKTELCIIIPFLQRYRNTPGENDGYDRFLQEVFKSVTLAVMARVEENTFIEVIVESASYIFSFIMKHYWDLDYYMPSDLPQKGLFDKSIFEFGGFKQHSFEFKRLISAASDPALANDIANEIYHGKYGKRKNSQRILSLTNSLIMHLCDLEVVMNSYDESMDLLNRLEKKYNTLEKVEDDDFLGMFE